MPKVVGHHFYQHYAHQGGDRSGMRKPHKFHKSTVVSVAAKQASPNDIVAPSKEQKNNYKK